MSAGEIRTLENQPRRKLAAKENSGSGCRLTLQQRDLGLRVAGKLAGCSIARETLPARRPTAIDNGAAVLRGHASQEAELTDTTLLGGLERSFHGECLG